MTMAYNVLLFAAIGAGFVVAIGAVNGPLCATLSLLLSIAVVSFLEWCKPYEHAWQPRWHEARDDVVFLATTIGARSLGGKIASQLTHTYALMSIDDIAQAFPPLIFLTALLVSDFCMYWLHRLLHEPLLGQLIFSLLWPLHKVHHWPDKLYFLNNSRMHPLNQLLNSCIRLLPLLLLGYPSTYCEGVILTISTVSFLAHSNMDVKHAILTKWLNVPACHRLHHSCDLDVAKNYSSLFLIWDHLFGTYRDPETTLDGEVGLEGYSGVPGLFHQYFTPGNEELPPCRAHTLWGVPCVALRLSDANLGQAKGPFPCSHPYGV